MTRDTAILRLGPDTSSDVEWIYPDAGTGEPARGRGTLEDAAQACAGRRVAVLVPATAVLLTTANIPTRNQQRILQALPYMLEDQLATDVDRLHFAPGRRDDSGRIPAAVVERDQMDGWTGALHAAGIEADTLIPETLALPVEPDSWTVYVHGDTALIRTGEQGGFAVEVDNLGLLLPRALDEAGEARPQRALVYGDQERIGDGMLAPLEVERRGRGADEQALGFFARHLDGRNAINLLQGRYSRREQLGRLWRPWIPSAVLLGALLLVNAGMTVADYLRLKDANARLEQEIESIYREAFPEARRIVNPRVQMERRLESLRAGGSGEAHGFLDLLSETAAPLKETEGATLQRISYRDGKLGLALVIGDLQGLDRLEQRLTEKADLAVEIQSATARDDGVEARLQLTKEMP